MRWSGEKEVVVFRVEYDRIMDSLVCESSDCGLFVL